MTTTEPHTSTCPAQRARRRRRAVAALLAVGGVTLVGTGALASWNVSKDAAPSSVAAATAAVEVLPANGMPLTANIANLVPGDFFYRYVDVRNDGSTAAAFTGLVSATGALAPWLDVEVASCPSAWSTGQLGCAGAAGTPVGAAGTVTATGRAVDHGTIQPGSGAVQRLRYKFTFNSTAPSDVQAESSTLSIRVTSTLVGGRDRTGG
ncbi:hypothetical protein [Kineococcus sp. SYSU DK004]|uniref:hypothetical protein n=1 Tax=Kineococcus sp. SYSU DK004 TaxID=3383125 RepID=UPI003D7E80D4